MLFILYNLRFSRKPSSVVHIIKIFLHRRIVTPHVLVKYVQLVYSNFKTKLFVWRVADKSI